MTELVFILDRSGSMSGLEGTVKGTVKSYAQISLQTLAE